MKEPQWQRERAVVRRVVRVVRMRKGCMLSWQTRLVGCIG